MSNALRKRRMDSLREVMIELAQASLRSDLSIARLSQEMREYCEEGRIERQASRDEMVAFKDEMRAFRDKGREERRAFKEEKPTFGDEGREETRAFKGEMRVFRDEAIRDRQRMNKQWGDLANRLGTLVEDIVAPSLPRVAADLLGCDAPELFAVRVVKRRGGETREYDALVVCPDSVLVNETKSRLQDQHIDSLLEKLAELPRFCPEYAGRRAVGVLASLYPDAGVVNRATRRGVLVMGMGDEAMQVLNPEALQSKG